MDMFGNKIFPALDAKIKENSVLAVAQIFKQGSLALIAQVLDLDVEQVKIICTNLIDRHALVAQLNVDDMVRTSCFQGTECPGSEDDHGFSLLLDTVIGRVRSGNVKV